MLFLSRKPPFVFFKNTNSFLVANFKANVKKMYEGLLFCVIGQKNNIVTQKTILNYEKGVTQYQTTAITVMYAHIFRY